MELITRLKNIGAKTMWVPELPIKHPWHPATRSVGARRLRAARRLIKFYYSWVSEYGGIEQSWVIEYRRRMLCSSLTSVSTDEIIAEVPSIKEASYVFFADFLVKARRLLGRSGRVPDTRALDE